MENSQNITLPISLKNISKRVNNIMGQTQNRFQVDKCFEMAHIAFPQESDTSQRFFFFRLICKSDDYVLDLKQKMCGKNNATTILQ